MEEKPVGKTLLEKAQKLPMTNETWQGTARLARAWITPDDRAPYRPYIILFMDQVHDKVMGSHIVEARPTPEEILDVLLQAMTRPAAGAGRPRRPMRLLIDAAEMAEALSPRLADLGIRCQFHPVPLIDQALREMEAFLQGRPPLPGLLQIPGVTPQIAEGFYQAAASFYRQAPWRWLSDAYPIEIRFPPHDRPRYTALMGYGGYAYGLATYESLDSIRLIYTGIPPNQLVGRITGVCLMFGTALEMPFDDLDDMNRYGWPVAGESAYPRLFRILLSGEPAPPTRSDVLWFEAALRAVPVFVRDYMHADRGEPRPAEVTLPVTTAEGPAEIYLRYPVPGLESQDWTLSLILNPPRKRRKRGGG
ncbi:MAG: hypothetical protein J7575_01620 [Chloroflexi bacterium]|nr:hypothetical protein [Chloroflexota bacterium]